MHFDERVVTGEKPRRHKFHATPTVVDGIRFASKAEAKRYGELKLLEKAGEIVDLKLQPKYPLLVGGHKVGSYVADFEYSRVEERGKVMHRVVEDVKGLPTPLYRWKKKHFEIQYNWRITEVSR